MGEWLYAIGLAALLPLWGCLLLITGESIRIVRLSLRSQQLPPDDDHADRGPDRPWLLAIRRESVKWGIFGTMIIFSICLIDRVADYGILASLLVWALLNVPIHRIRPGKRGLARYRSVG